MGMESTHFRRFNAPTASVWGSALGNLRKVGGGLGRSRPLVADGLAPKTVDSYGYVSTKDADIGMNLCLPMLQL